MNEWISSFLLFGFYMFHPLPHGQHWTSAPPTVQSYCGHSLRTTESSVVYLAGFANGCGLCRCQNPHLSHSGSAAKLSQYRNPIHWIPLWCLMKQLVAYCWVLFFVTQVITQIFMLRNFVFLYASSVFVKHLDAPNPRKPREPRKPCKPRKPRKPRKRDSELSGFLTQKRLPEI